MVTYFRQRDFVSSSHAFPVHIDQLKAAGLKSNFCVSDAAFVATLRQCFKNFTKNVQKAAFFLALALKKQFRY